MNERPISPITGEPFKVENYYFQVILLRLQAKEALRSREVDFVFTVLKDSRKFQSSKKVTLEVGSVHTHPLPNIKLNFVVINYNPGKSEVFALRISEENGSVLKEVGEYLIDANNFIDHFTQTENGAFTLQAKLNEDYSADIEIYVEKSRYGVERLIRDVKNPKPKEKDAEPVTITHQKIAEQKKYLPLPDEEEMPHHRQKFSKFSPKREVEEVKRDQFMNKTRDDAKPRPAEIPLDRPQEKPRKESPKRRQEPPPPAVRPVKPAEPEKVDAINTKTNSRDVSRVSESSDNKLKNSTAKAKPAPPKEEMKSSRVRKPAPEPSFLESLPINIKYLIPAVLLLIVGLLYASFSGEEKPQQPLFPKLQQPSTGKPGKAEKIQKADKPQKKGKGKKAKK